MEKGDDVTDGYLIAFGTHHILQAKYQEDQSADTIIIVGGDGIYSGFIRSIIDITEKNVIAVSWKDSLADTLAKVHNSVKIELLEDIFNVADTACVTNGLFEAYALTEVEQEIITFLLKAKNPQGYMRNALVYAIKKWNNASVKQQFQDDFDKIVQYLFQARKIMESLK